MHYHAKECISVCIFHILMVLTCFFLSMVWRCMNKGPQNNSDKLFQYTIVTKHVLDIVFSTYLGTTVSSIVNFVSDTTTSVKSMHCDLA